ncbi:unnamed protein product [Ectocarpus sp. CCAP 1310/34]|nr:unnamed protein product [Ectocarpus sp. CCAP 1310/34]
MGPMRFPCLVLVSLLLTQALGFAFVGLRPPLGLSGTSRARSGGSSTSHEQHQQHRCLRIGVGSRSGAGRESSLLAGINGEEDDVDVVPARTFVSGSNQPERICVLGGGFGGLYTALRLQKMPWRGRRPVVTLVDKRDKFTFLPLLYEFAIGNAELDEVAPTFRELLAGSGVSFVQGCVSNIDLDGKGVTVAGATSDDLDGFMVSDNADESEDILGVGARTLEYDKLVLAVGAEPASAIDKVPGARERAIPFYSIEDSYRVKQAIIKLKALVREKTVSRVVVVGGSYAGVELSCNLATELGGGRKGKGKVEVTLAAGSEVLAMATSGNREAGLRRLAESGVHVMKGARVSEVKEGGGVVLQQGEGKARTGTDSAGGEEIMADLLVWTAGSQPSSLLEPLDVRKDARGRIEVDRKLRVVEAAGSAGGVGDVYCLGDIAAVEGLELGCNAQVALQQSDYVAYNIWADKERRKPLDFRWVCADDKVVPAWDKSNRL